MTCVTTLHDTFGVGVFHDAIQLDVTEMSQPDAHWTGFLQSAYLHKTKYLIIHHQNRQFIHFIPPLANHCGLGCLAQIFQNFELGHFYTLTRQKLQKLRVPRTVYGNLGILITVFHGLPVN